MRHSDRLLRDGLRLLNVRYWAPLVFLISCGPAGASSDDSAKLGTLLIGYRADFAGVKYLFQGTLDLAGPQSYSVDSEYAPLTTQQALVPGHYVMTIRPGFRVLEDVAIALVPVAGELRADSSLALDIEPATTAHASFQFVAAGRISFRAN